MDGRHDEAALRTQDARELLKYGRPLLNVAQHQITEYQVECIAVSKVEWGSQIRVVECCVLTESVASMANRGLTCINTDYRRTLLVELRHIVATSASSKQYPTVPEVREDGLCRRP